MRRAPEEAVAENKQAVHDYGAANEPAGGVVGLTGEMALQEAGKKA